MNPLWTLGICPCWRRIGSLVTLSVASRYSWSWSSRSCRGCERHGGHPRQVMTGSAQWTDWAEIFCRCLCSECCVTLAMQKL